MPNQSSFFWYDLETSGRDPRRHRIMQFAGQRTTLDLMPIGEPLNWQVRLADDVLPEAGAVLITGLTPQVVADGISEVELVRRLHEHVFTPGTIMTGFNSVRFDDEFLRYTCYRNFYDAYAWAYKDGRSRWDLLDVVRMTRALRPAGITWPRDEANDPINTLVELTHANGLDHTKAHDALSDVTALIQLAGLLQHAQPRLWQYLLNLRSKDAVAGVIKPQAPEPFLYTNGMYGREHDFTTVGVIIGAERTGTYLIYDLRHDPRQFEGLSTAELTRRLFSKREDLETQGLTRLPVKTLSTNKCPAVAPLATLAEAAARLKLDMAVIADHWKFLQSSQLPKNIATAYVAQAPYEAPTDPDGALYNGFVNDATACAQVRVADDRNITAIMPHFTDDRLVELFLRYKGRNFETQLSESDHAAWESYRSARILGDIEAWSNELQDRFAVATPAEQTLLTDLQLWAESIYPAEM